MTRRLLNLLTALWLLLCVASVAMWVRSQSVTEMWRFPTRYGPAAPGERLLGSAKGWKFVSMVGSGDGRLVWFDAKQYDRPHQVVGTPVEADGYRKVIGTGRLPRGVGSLAGTYGKSRAHRVTVPWVAEVTWSPEQRVRTGPPPSGAFVSYGRHWCASVSWWVPAVAAAMLPAARGFHGLKRARRRRAEGVCPACGYDLRATPGRCPECGTPGASAASP